MYMEKTEYEKPILFASEIGQYGYCPVSWYLQKCGYKPESLLLRRGVKKHRSYGKKLEKVKKQEMATRFVFIVGIFGLLISLILLMFRVFL